MVHDSKKIYFNVFHIPLRFNQNEILCRILEDKGVISRVNVAIWGLSDVLTEVESPQYLYHNVLHLFDQYRFLSNQSSI
jgi:hypothetical protein